MKKVYEKPVILFENFSLSTSIAGDCETPFVNNATKGTCGVPTSAPHLTVFTDESTGCTIPDSDNDDMYGGLCYHVPTEYNNLFNS